MKLYYTPGACSMSPHIVARELGIDIELEKVDLGTKKTASGADFLSINPKGYVPVLQLDDGSVITEGPAIVQYLADQKPSSTLAPANGTVERSRLQALLGYINSELHKSYSPLFNSATPAETRTEREEYLNKRYGYIENELQGKSFLTGNEFTVADAYLYTVTTWAGHVKVDLSGFPNLNAFQKRVADRPAVKAVAAAESQG
ncbi:MAG: glutathione transferase GstA [Proteobacteria bacterium]|nr:glutathione transferase GstA [Pseudomonadota bacterium]MDA1357521.1 glutathione transferase GstA [Pseudomonadota bacterium]